MKKIVYLLILLSLLNIKTASSFILYGIVKGHIVDKATGKAIENANVIILETSYGAITDKGGFFKLKLPANQYEIVVKVMGYKSERKTCVIAPNAEITLNFELEPKVYEMQSVNVMADRFKSNTEISMFPLRSSELKRTPALVEPDILRAVAILPGVTSVNDFSSQFYVRGGNFDQTMILFDGAPVYNPYHLGGIFSMFYSEALGDVTLQAGGYPVQEDGYLSGILDIHTKKIIGAKKVTLSLASSGCIVEAQAKKSSFLFSLRRTYFDLFSLMLGEDIPYYFYDFIGKYTLDLNDNNKINISTFYSKDFLGALEEVELVKPYNKAPSWGNKLISVQWHSILSLNAFWEHHLSYSRSFCQAYTVHNNLTNNIKDFTLKENFYYQRGEHQLLWGLMFKKLDFSYYWDINYLDNLLADYVWPVADVFFDYAPPRFRFKKQNIQWGLYSQDAIQLSPKLFATVGLRLNRFSSSHKLDWSPRVNFCYEMTNRLKLKWTYGRFYQYLYTLKERQSDAIFSPFTVYFPVDSDQKIQPAASDHYIVGTELENLFWGLDLSYEVYYKNNHKLITSLDAIPRYQHENGFAFGGDLLIKKDEGKFRTWLSYSHGISKKIDHHREYYTSYDRPHTIKALGYLQLGRKWSLNFFWIYASGSPYTPLVGKFKGGWDWRNDVDSFYPIIDDDRDFITTRRLYGAKNSLRFPAYHRLDIGLSRRFYFWNHILYFNFQILNVYNHNNPFFYDYDVNTNYDNPAKNAKASKGLPILPSLSLEFEL